MESLSRSFTVSENHIITCKNIIHEPKSSLGTIFFENMNHNLDKIAQVDASTGETETFGQLLQKCIRTALHLSDRKINRNDIICMCSYNHLNSAVPYIAAQFLGVKIACLDPTLSPDEISHFLVLIRPKFLFVVRGILPLIKKIIEEREIPTELVVFEENFSNFLEPHPLEDGFQPVKIENLQETAAIHFSSGVSGMPKGVCLSHYALAGQGSNYTQTENPDVEYMKKLAARISFPVTQLTYSSLYWISSAIMLVATTVMVNCRVVCEKFDPNDVWNHIEQYKPFLVILIPFQVIEMLKKPKPDVDISSVQSIIIVGSSISKEHIRNLQQYFPEVDINRGYGQTEVCGSIVNFKAADLIHRPLMKQKLDSVGLPLRGFSYKVVDLETGKNLGPLQKGELRLKTKFAMNGYFGQDSSTVYDEDGWLKTGDVVYYDEDYCFYVIDRIREAFKYRNWFIAPSLLETKLLTHPAIDKVAVVGIPKEDGHHPMGLVVLKKGCVVSEKEIMKFLEERVPERFWLRAGVRFVDDLPITATGKLKRSGVKKLALDLCGDCKS